MTHDLSHSQALITFTIIGIPNISHTILCHTPFFTPFQSSLHSHLHLSLFHIFLLLQTAEVNLHMHLQVSCHIIYLVSLILDIKFNTLTFMFLIIYGAHNLGYGSLILLQLPMHLFTLIL